MTAPVMSRDEYLKAKYVWSGGDVVVSGQAPDPNASTQPVRDRKSRK